MTKCRPPISLHHEPVVSCQPFLNPSTFHQTKTVMAESSPTAKPAAQEGTSDPLLSLPSPIVREGDHVILAFADGRQIFAQCLTSGRGKAVPLKISKRSYPTKHLVGLPYGSLLELTNSGLVALADGEGLLPSFTLPQQPESDANADDTTFPPIDNRHIVDNNKSQALRHQDLLQMREQGTEGSVIVEKIVENSATFEQKTEYSKAKYIAKKQMKYQPRCRIVRCTASSICEALYQREPKKLMNMREDTLGQILSYSNIYAGCQALVLETCNGIVTGAVAQRLAGYGRIFAVYSGQQPSFSEMLQRYNLSFAENFSIKWLHSGDIFGEAEEEEEPDAEKADRDKMRWPCPLQDHTRAYMKTMKSEKEKAYFVAKRSARFARKLTRHTAAEAKEWCKARQSDSLIIVARYDPTKTLLQMLPYLSSSCPFVVYSEFVEPLTECFLELQRRNLAINLRLSDTWTREYQVLPGRTHPNMSMSQSGGFILTGTKLDPETGTNELDEELLKEIRAQIGGRRGNKAANAKTEKKKRRKERQKAEETGAQGSSKRLKSANKESPS